MQEWSRLALEMGFSAVAEMDPRRLTVRPEVRAWCTEDKCGSYNTSWACPPGCGSLEDCAALLRRYTRGILLVTNIFRDNPAEQDVLLNGYAAHQARFRDFAACFCQENPGALLLGAGACSVCDICSYPQAPCRNPSARVSSLEACGVLVEEVCRDCGLTYYTGRNVSFVACCLI